MVDFSKIKDIELNNVKRILDEYALKFQDLVKHNITEKNSNGYNHVATGNLLASIHTSIDFGAEKYTVYLHSKDYLKFLEEGRGPGKFPPPDKMLQWVRDKKLPTKESTGDKSLPREKSLAYLVGKKISEHGTKPYPVVANTMEELNEIYTGKLEEALLEDIKKWLPIIHIQLHFK